MRPALRFCIPVLAMCTVALFAASCAPAPPTVSAVEPAAGPSGGGTEIVLKGEGFRVGVQVMIGESLAEVKALDPSGTSVTVVTPGGKVGEHQISARHGEKGTPSETLTFTYQPVRILETSPAGDSAIAWDDRPESVEVRFNQPLDVSTAKIAVRPPAESDDEEGEEPEPLDGVANYDQDTSKLTFTATKKFGEGEHTVAVSGLNDLAGNAVDQVRFSFKINPRPKVASRSTGRRSSGSSGGGSSGRRAGKTYDDGTLETGYFGRDYRFVDTRRVDYLWVRDGFSFEGQSFHFQPWGEPVFIGEDAEKRDAEDWRLARQMTPEIPQALVDILSHTWRGKADVSTRSGNIKVTGRIVDCSTGNMTAKVLVGFGAGAGYTTFDMKFTDARTGQLVAAIHHRVVSGTAWSTTDSKLVKWMEKFGKQVVKRDFDGLYKRGDVVDD